MTNWLILTDLDGALVDLETYSYDAAREALGRIREANIPLAFVSSKTRGELERIRTEMGIPGPNISENGAVILYPDGSTERMGVRIEALREALADLARELGFEPLTFEHGGVEGVMRDTGLGVEQARLAMEREGDQPFKVPGMDLARLQAAAATRGLNVIQGDRYCHLIGHPGKGAACRRLLDWYKARGMNYRTIAIGDAPNDITLLEQGDIAICVPREDGRIHPEILEALPDVRIAPKPGPTGWNQSILEVLDSDGVKGA